MEQRTTTHAPRHSGVPQSARDFSVDGRVVIITGAGQGIGREYALHFAAAGAKVVVVDVNGDNTAAVAEEVRAAGGQALAVQADVGDKASVDRMAARVLEEYGRIDVLINNASIFASLGKQMFDDIPLAEWEQVLRVNVTGSYLCAAAVAPAMRAAEWGRIINVSSSAVVQGKTEYLHYVTSKSAVVGMTNAMARELGPYGITVNAIRPGGVATEVDRTANPTIEHRVRLMGLQCLPRGGLPQDMIGLVVFLCTQAAAYITGQTIACDGGLTHGS